METDMRGNFSSRFNIGDAVRISGGRFIVHAVKFSDSVVYDVKLPEDESGHIIRDIPAALIDG